MAEPASRSGLKRDLRRETQRLLHHIDHVSLADLEILDGIVSDLAQIHVNDTACKAACTTHGQDYVPWGTKYAPWWERIWKGLFPQ